MEFKVRTKGNADPQGKPRVYFTCHPEDLARTFDKVCDDIFKTHDCAIYYTADMATEIPAESRDLDLDRMNLFVLPVTLKLLSTPNRAMDSDHLYAKEKHIPVLPLLFEPGLDEIYSRKDKFGELQYLDLYSRDATAIRYEEKLEKYLDAVLVSDETAQRIRAAFDAYIFLSYRKKDRKYANELMRLIHSNPLCRDIAIWYDEFLVPGENFNDRIDEVLQKSDLFTLLVTPNLVGEANYVQSTEYPAAQKANKEILPAEMVATDRQELQDQFPDIPACVNASDEGQFNQGLLAAVKDLALRENDSDPVHSFLIGLAYLNGIDVEVDRERALELITAAAEAELPEAMLTLRSMYRDGVGVERDYRKALEWFKRNADFYTKEYGEEDPDTLTALSDLAFAYGEFGEHKEALALQERVYRLRCNILGEEHPETVVALSNLALTCDELGYRERAIELQEQARRSMCKKLGENHPDTLTAMNNLASSYLEAGDFKKATALQEKVYKLRCKALGEEHPDTLAALNNLAMFYSVAGHPKKAIKLQEKVCPLTCKVMGKEHPETLMALCNLGMIYRALGNPEKAVELMEEMYPRLCRVFYKEHPWALRVANNLATAYSDLGNYGKAIELLEEVYPLRRQVLGEEHPDTLTALINLAFTYYNMGNYPKAIEEFEKTYPLQCKVFGKDHPDTLAVKELLNLLHSRSGST